MKNSLKEVLDEFHYHEAMDRCSLIADLIDSSLIQHPVFKVEKEVAEKVEEANMLLYEAYQLLGSIHFNKDK